MTGGIGMKFLKIYLLGFAIVFVFLTIVEIIGKIKAYRRTGRWNSHKFEWKSIIYFSLYSFRFFAIWLHDTIGDNFYI